MTIEEVIEQLKKSELIGSNIFVLPIEKQNNILCNIILKQHLIKPVITFKFVDAGNITASLYIPNKNNFLRKKHNNIIIQELDMIYALLISRKEIITVNVGEEYQQDLHKQNILPSATLSMFFNEYAILPEKIKLDIFPVNPKIVQSTEFN
jgi:hypothetical protein